MLTVSLTSGLLLASSVCDLRNLSKLVKKLFHFGSGQDCEWCRVWLPTVLVRTAPMSDLWLCSVVLFSHLLEFRFYFFIYHIFFNPCWAVSFKPAWRWGLFKTLKTRKGFTHQQFDDGFVVVIEIGWQWDKRICQWADWVILSSPDCYVIINDKKLYFSFQCCCCSRSKRSEHYYFFCLIVAKSSLQNRNCREEILSNVSCVSNTRPSKYDDIILPFW